MAAGWYIAKNRQKLGPYSSTQLKELADSGQLLATDMVHRDEMPKWIPASQIKGLFPTEAVVVQSASPAQPDILEAVSVVQPVPAFPEAQPQIQVPALTHTGSTSNETPAHVMNSLGSILPAVGTVSPTPRPSSPPVNAASPAGNGGVNGSAKAKLVAAIDKLRATWKPQSTALKAGVIGGGVCVLLSCFLCCGMATFMTSQHEKAVKKELAEANQLWSSGSKAGAAAKYKQLIENDLSSVDTSERPTVFQRAIEYEVEQGNTSSAKKLIEKALDRRISLALNNPAANQVMAQVQAERETQKLAEAQRKKRKQEEREQKKGDDTESGSRFGWGGEKHKGSVKQPEQASGDQGVSSKQMETLFESLVLRIKPGMSSNQVTEILGRPHDIQKPKPELVRDFPALSGQETWTWRNKEDHGSFIMLSFVKGVLKDGGTPGYDINKGFKSQLPANMSAEEKARLRDPMKKLGVTPIE